MPPALEDRADGLILRVRVQPKASREGVKGLSADAAQVQISLCAPPVDGAANAALIAFVAKRLGAPKSSIQLISGEKSREKVLLIPGKDSQQAAAALGLLPA